MSVELYDENEEPLGQVASTGGYADLVAYADELDGCEDLYDFITNGETDDPAAVKDDITRALEDAPKEVASILRTLAELLDKVEGTVFVQ